MNTKDMIFIPTDEKDFIVSPRFFWLCKLKKNSWQWTYDNMLGFGVRFENEEDAIMFKLMNAA
jgi:hypothetical protein